MPRFAYKGIDAAGNPDEGWLDCGSSSDAYAILQSRGLTIYQLDDGSEEVERRPWYLRDIPLGRTGHKLEDQAATAELLSLLAKLGLPLTETLRIVSRSTSDGSIRAHLQRCIQLVSDGTSFHEAFERAGTGFVPLFARMIKVAETANTLEPSMRDLATHLRRVDKLKGKVNSALIYPLILIGAAIALMGVIVFYLAPTLAPMFASLGKPIPTSISVFLWLGNFLSTYWWAVGAVLIVGAVAIGTAISQGRAGVLVRKMPFIGKMTRDAALLRHVRALDMMVRGGMRLPEALMASAESELSSPFRETFKLAAENLQIGKQASEEIEKDPQLPSLFVDLFKVGEDANQLPETMGTLAGAIEQDVERSIQRALQVLTPALTLIIGGGIALLIYSVMGAILDINSLAL